MKTSIKYVRQAVCIKPARFNEAFDPKKINEFTAGDLTLKLFRIYRYKKSQTNKDVYKVYDELHLERSKNIPPANVHRDDFKKYLQPIVKRKHRVKGS